MSLSYALNGLAVRMLAILPASLILYSIGVVVYRIYFHPLSKYPGPLLAKITDLHQTYHALLGDRHLDFYHNHERYGSIYRFGPNSLSFNTNTALKDIYGFKANVQKAPFYQAFWASKDAASTHSSIDKSVHARKRRVLSHAFSDSAMKSMETHILAHVRKFCQNLAGSGLTAGQQTSPSPLPFPSSPESKGFGPPVDVSDQANYLTFDIMGDLCFGKPFNMLSSPTNRFAIDLIASAAHRHLICGTYLPIHTYRLDKLLFRKIAAGRARYMAYSKSQAAERMKQGSSSSSSSSTTDRKDFFHHLLRARDPETNAGFTLPELWGESNLLIIAGSDTTSTALAAAIHYLAHHPAIRTRLTQQIRTAFPSPDPEEIHLSSPAFPPLLRAVIDESMRLAPSVGGLLPREVLAGGMTIDGAAVPAGTLVGVPHYAIHHNARYYPEPFAFRPGRWMAGGDEGGAKGAVEVAQSAFCPFSVGPRGCIGKGMAYAELSVTLARVLWMYDMRLAGSSVGAAGEGVEFELKDTFTSMKTGPLVEFRRREEAT